MTAHSTVRQTANDSDEGRQHSINARASEEAVVPQLLTVDEVANIFRVSPSAIYQQRHRGEQPGALGIQIGRRILFRPADLDALLGMLLES